MIYYVIATYVPATNVPLKYHISVTAKITWGALMVEGQHMYHIWTQWCQLCDHEHCIQMATPTAMSWPYVYVVCQSLTA